MALRALVVMDYQNVHLTGHDLFAPAGTAKHESLIHPLYYANQVIGARNHRQVLAGSAGGQHAELAAVEVYQGQPSNKHDPKPYGRSLAHKSEWTRDRRVKVNYRPLRYYWDHQLGDFRKQEKGVDVLVALRVVKAAEVSDFDIVILASHDTDLEPALEDAVERGSIAVETAAWKGGKRLASRLDVGRNILDGGAFVRSRDRKNYN